MLSIRRRPVITNLRVDLFEALVSCQWSQLLHVTLVLCQQAVVACCIAAAKPATSQQVFPLQWAAARPSSWGQGEIIPVPGSRCLDTGDQRGREIDTLTCSCPLDGHGMETETPPPPTNAMSPLNIDVVTLHRDAWHVTRVQICCVTAAVMISFLLTPLEVATSDLGRQRSRAGYGN